MKIYIPNLDIWFTDEIWTIGYYASEDEAKIAIRTVIDDWNQIYPQPPDSIDWKDFAIEVYEFGDFDSQFQEFMKEQSFDKKLSTTENRCFLEG